MRKFIERLFFTNNKKGADEFAFQSKNLLILLENPQRCDFLGLHNESVPVG
jgi:hypothetical protein